MPSTVLIVRTPASTINLIVGFYRDVRLSSSFGAAAVPVRSPGTIVRAKEKATIFYIGVDNYPFAARNNASGPDNTFNVTIQATSGTKPKVISGDKQLDITIPPGT